MKLLVFILLTGSCFLHTAAQTDYRDPFLGLYHTSTPPCVNANSQTPPHHYTLIEKDTTSATGIIVTDTTVWGPTGYLRHGTLNQADSTYYDGAVLGKFVHGDSLKKTLPGWVCPPGYIFYLRKIWPIGLYHAKNKENPWYLFPNPALHSFNILIPGSNDKAEVELLDLSGKILIKKEFYSGVELNVADIPRGIYLVRVTGSDFLLTKRLVLTD